ncbi:MAG TPA: hypothetical protein VGR95_12500 [Thermoanaerobaculia bacterium]|jgi:hypothetical protein|nr:hypothetical protein [Thermoanaerobaculia bacterium]
MTTYGIVGSRHWNDYVKLAAHLAGRGINDVVSGGTLGTDAMAQAWATGGGIPFTLCPTKREPGGSFAAACRRRNQQIVDESDSLIAFPCQHSKGTWDTIRRAKKKGIPVEVIKVDCEGKG